MDTPAADGRRAASIDLHPLALEDCREQGCAADLARGAVLFGAPREARRYLIFDLGVRYRCMDEARHRARNTAQNMTTLRHFALNLIRQDTDRKVGVANARKRAGWDPNYLIKLLTTAES